MSDDWNTPGSRRPERSEGPRAPYSDYSSASSPFSPAYSPPEEAINLREIAGALRRHALLAFSCVTACLVLSVVALKVVPRKFKSVASIEIKNSYFEIPLLSDFGSGHDPGEMASEKSALIRAAIDDDFIDRLGGEFGLYKAPAGSSARRVEREAVRARIDWMSTSPTSYQFSAVLDDPARAARMNAEVLAQVKDRFVETREKSILQYRASLKRELDALGIAAGGGVPGAVASGSSDLAREELAELQRRLQALKGQYTENHPRVVALVKRAEFLKRMISDPTGRAAVGDAGAPRREALEGRSGKDSKSDIYEELFKKVNYLDVVIELEKDKNDVPYFDVIEEPSVPVSAVFPKLPNFLLAGALVGALIAGILIGYLELKRSAEMTPLEISAALGVPLLGVLPYLNTLDDQVIEAERGECHPARRT